MVDYLLAIEDSRSQRETSIGLIATMAGERNILPSCSRLSPLTLESSNALLSPLSSHGQQLIALLHTQKH